MKAEQISYQTYVMFISKRREKGGRRKASYFHFVSFILCCYSLCLCNFLMLFIQTKINPFWEVDSKLLDRQKSGRKTITLFSMTAIVKGKKNK